MNLDSGDVVADAILGGSYHGCLARARRCHRGSARGLARAWVSAARHCTKLSAADAAGLAGWHDSEMGFWYRAAKPGEATVLRSHDRTGRRIAVIHESNVERACSRDGLPSKRQDRER